MLSNTAVPKYYGRFREQVLNGEIAVCETISMEMNRIDDLIRDPHYYYDDEAVEGWIAYCNGELTLTDGRDLKLLESFKLWGEQLYGWYYFTETKVYKPSKKGKGKGRYVRKRKKHRLTLKQYLIVARGAAKTMYLSTIQSFGLNIDTATTHQITTAPTLKQADEVLSPIRTSIVRSRGPLFQLLTEGSLQNTTGSKANRQKLASTKDGIVNFITGSLLETKPLSINKLQGLRTKYASVDEWLSGVLREDPIAAIEQGAAKGGIDDYMILAASSEGCVRNACGDDIKMELMKILKGEYYAPHVSIWYYRLDDIHEINDPEMWIKANPNIGLTVTYEAYQRDVERAEHAPAARNDIIAKRFGIPMEGLTYFFTYNETQPHRHRTFNGMPCSLGLDLSQGDDFCAATFLFPLQRGRYGIKCRSYISSRTLDRLPRTMREKYGRFMREGSLVVLEGTTIDIMEVYEDLDRFIEENDYDVECLGYDPYNAREFIERWMTENSEYGVEKVIQGYRTESVPLGELKDLAEDRLLLFDEELMVFCMSNASVIEDTNGNRKLCKSRFDEKIDNVAAMMDAYVAYKLHKEDFE